MDIFSTLHSIIAFLIVIPIIVFVHEFGHFIVARWCGVKVESFSIGFGKELFGWQDRHQTRWKVCLLPLGGYVQMLGQSDTPDQRQKKKISKEEEKVHFMHKKLWQRALIIFAGPCINYLFAIVIFCLTYGFIGKPQTPPIIGEVLKESAAAVAGLKPGDLIVKMNNHLLKSFEEIRKITLLEGHRSISLTIKRANKEINLSITPQKTGEDQVPLLGIGATKTIDYIQKLSPLEAFSAAIKDTYDITINTIKALGQMITGERSTKELGGIIRIAEFSGDAASAGLISFIFFIAVLSINLGLLNIFPILPLDGGHLLLQGIEKIKGSPLSEKMQEWSFKIGLVFVMSLMVLATWNDIIRIINRLSS